MIITKMACNMCAEIWRRDFWRKSFAGPLSTPADWRWRRRLLPRMTAKRRPRAHPGRKCGQAERDGEGSGTGEGARWEVNFVGLF